MNERGLLAEEWRVVCGEEEKPKQFLNPNSIQEDARDEGVILPCGFFRGDARAPTCEGVHH